MSEQPEQPSPRRGGWWFFIILPAGLVLVLLHLFWALLPLIIIVTVVNARHREQGVKVPGRWMALTWKADDTLPMRGRGPAGRDDQDGSA